MHWMNCEVVPMEFITLEDIDDNILTCKDSDVDYANDFLLSLATSYGLEEGDILTPCRMRVKRLGIAIACRECAAAMIGSDTTVMVNGQRGDDVYMQKYKVYAELVKEFESSLSFADFAADGTESAGKGGVGMVRLYRA